MYVCLHVWKRETERQMNNNIKWKNKRQRDTETERQGDRKTQRHRDAEKEMKERQSERETEIYYFSLYRSKVGRFLVYEDCSTFNRSDDFTLAIPFQGNNDQQSEGILYYIERVFWRINPV